VPEVRKYLFIPGLAKAGTTFLFDQLARDEDIFNIPKNKELNYFNTNIESISSAGFFSRFKTNDDSKIYIDASPTYLQSGQQEVASRIKAVLSPEEISVIILLRSPVEAVYSHYLHDLKSHVARLHHNKMNRSDYRLYDRSVLKKYMSRRHLSIQKFSELFPGRVFGLHMSDLFGEGVSSRISEIVGAKVSDFDSGKISNPGGWVPYYIYGGERGCEFYQDEVIYRVPPKALVLVSNGRSEIKFDVSEEEAYRKLNLASTFTRSFVGSTKLFASAIDDYYKSCDILGMKPLPLELDGEVKFEAQTPSLSRDILMQLTRHKDASVRFNMSAT
tara:strand:- start:2399 stop:3391 length:993 start_codon:yes stop_codon:yes gene_type:complete